jgi:hypothetical protein
VTEWFIFLAERAFVQLNHGVDLYAVLRGHLWLERDVLDLLQLRIPNESQKRGFLKRIKLARKHGLLNEGDFAFLKALNDVRNSFAHDLERETLSREDDDVLFGTSSDQLRALYARLTVDVDEPEFNRAEGLRFRGLIAAMHIRLLEVVEKEKTARDSRA